LEPQVDEKEAEDYAILWNVNQDGGRVKPCCSIAAFRIDILDVPRSPWNRSAAQVFCKSFLPESEHNPDTVKATEDAFFIRIKSLKKDYQNADGDSEARKRNARVARRNSRKYHVRVALLIARKYLNCVTAVSTAV
jgi:hypothetical protein